MNVKAVNGFIVTVLLFSLMVLSCGCKEPQFEYVNLQISPQQIMAGDTISVSIELKNVGTAKGICPVTLSINEEEIEGREVSIESGETKTVTFTIAGKSPGTYKIDINNYFTTITVLRPAEFKLEKLSVSPGEVQMGREVRVVAGIRNSGDVEGLHHLSLTVDEVEIESRDVLVKPASLEEATFSFCPKNRGTFLMEINGQSVQLKVKAPGEMFIGQWVNEDSNTGGITKVLIDYVDGKIAVQMWGKCHPEDCWWNGSPWFIENKVSLFGEETISATWTFTFAIESQTLRVLADGKLSIVGYTHYTDNSGRRDYDYLYYFKRAVP